MDATKLPKGQSPERHTDGRPVNLPGRYVHKGTKQEFITADGDEGIVQADAIVRQGGFERVGDVPTRVELLERRKAQQLKDAAAEAKQKKADKAELEKAVAAVK